MSQNGHLMNLLSIEAKADKECQITRRHPGHTPHAPTLASLPKSQSLLEDGWEVAHRQMLALKQAKAVHHVGTIAWEVFEDPYMMAYLKSLAEGPPLPSYTPGNAEKVSAVHPPNPDTADPGGLLYRIDTEAMTKVNSRIAQRNAFKTLMVDGWDDESRAVPLAGLLHRYDPSNNVQEDSRHCRLGLH